ncbi:MAG: hypothetical protein ABIA97_05015 [Candidatus Omnitrophota bacterium]
MLKEIIDKGQKLGIKEKRRFSDEYCELIVFAKELNDWIDIFTEILGPASKPAGEKPTLDHLALTKDYGGIYENQILFKKEINNKIILAMVWPWQDKTHVTLKIAETSKPN